MVYEAKTIVLPGWLRSLAIALLLVGVIFRFVNLSHKVVWHDEVYTVIRAAGYTRREIDSVLFQNRIVPFGELQKFQQLKPGSTPADTLRSLALEDPQHPPLYFLLTRFWMQTLGRPITGAFNSLTMVRLPAVLIGLLAIPAAFALAWELFHEREVALLAAMLVAISPFDVLFAQTARQYSLLTVIVIVSLWLLLRALRRSQAATESFSKQAQKGLWQTWWWYALSVAVGLYTQPFFGLTLIAQIVFVALLWLVDHSRHVGRELRAFSFAVGGAIALYLPWLIVMVMNRSRLMETTSWAQSFPGFDYFLKLWTLSFTALFFDLDFGFTNPATFLMRAPFVLLIGVAMIVLWRSCNRRVWLAVLTSTLVPFLLLVGPDLFLGSKRSAVSRYLVSCFPGVQMAVAWFLAARLTQKPTNASGQLRIFASSRSKSSFRLQQVVWQGIFLLIAIASLASLTVSAASFTWWNRDASYFNNRIAEIINRTSSPIVISDIGSDYTNLGDLLSISYLVKRDVPLLGLANSAQIVKTPEFAKQIQGKTALAFRPSQVLKDSLESKFGKLTHFSDVERLWQVPTLDSR